MSQVGHGMMALVSFDHASLVLAEEVRDAVDTYRVEIPPACAEEVHGVAGTVS